MTNNNRLRVFLNRGTIKGRILSRARSKKDIIFGGKSIQKQLGLRARPTKDYDLFTNEPKMSAIELEKNFNKLTRGDNFFVKKGKNPSTYKVKYRGRDLIKGTKDDETIVDFTKTPKPIPDFKKINEIRYRSLDEELKAKVRLIKDPRFEFRNEKDLRDLEILRRLRKK